MFRILDRYLIREVVLPFALALAVSTFVLEIPIILREGEALLAKGVEWQIIVRVLVALLPSSLCVTIPIALLFGILLGLGRLAGDREFVALQACGVSLLRLMRPVVVLAILATAWTAWETIVALPDGNQTFREITYSVVASRVESNVKPGVFFEDFNDLVIYVRELPPGGGWRDVFLADSRNGQTTVYFAREGRIVLDRVNRLVELQLVDGTSHTTKIDNKEGLESSEFKTFSLSLDPVKVFPPPPAKGAPEMTFAELKTAIAAAETRHDPGYLPRFMYQQKLSLPATCPILALIGLAIAASNRKDGKIAGFVIGLGVIVTYYILLYGSRAAALGGRLSPEWAPWIPNILMGVMAIVMIAFRTRISDRPFQFRVPVFWRRKAAGETIGTEGLPRSAAVVRPRMTVVLRVPHLNLPTPRLLDLYLVREYLQVFFLSIGSLLVLFYISTFIDVADKLFRGQATSAMLLNFFYYRTPLYVYYVIPMAVLVAALVTIGAMTKNSELIVMRACGISLYRTAAPVFIFALATSGVLFALQERVLARSNKEADRLERIIRGWPPATTALDRRWLIGRDNNLYHYDLFDPAANRFTRLFLYEIDRASWGLKSIAEADEVTFVRDTRTASSGRWMGRRGWLRQFGALTRRGVRPAPKYTPFDERELPLEPPSYFRNESPDPEQMTYEQLRGYVARLRASGADATPSLVSLQRKIAFPFVTVIMALLAVPFAVLTGRRGALTGIGVGVAMAITYWVLMSVFGALGAGGVLDATIAAWAPNILFGSAALYAILTVRT